MNSKRKIAAFLKESNAIEGVYDDDSFVTARHAWKYLLGCDRLQVANILRAHSLLMSNQPIAHKDKGAYRDCGVTVGGRICPEPFTVPARMEGWIYGANMLPIKTEDSIKEDHIWFECIHPFIDGNGRIGRILMNWQRVKSGLDILVIKESEKHKYYEWFDEDSK